MMEHRLKADVVVFDWSGTLSDDMDSVYDTVVAIRRHFGFDEKVPKEEWQKLTMASAIDFFRQHGVHMDKKRIVETFSKFYAENSDKTHAYKDAFPLLKELKDAGKRIAVVSGHPQEHVEKELARYGFDKLIPLENVWGSVNDKTGKLKELVERFDVRPDQMVYVGDMIWDVRSAKAAGVKSVALKRGYHGDMLDSENADLLVEDLTELLGAIE